jgi:hypothetical protein
MKFREIHTIALIMEHFGMAAYNIVPDDVMYFMNKEDYLQQPWLF